MNVNLKILLIEALRTIICVSLITFSIACLIKKGGLL